MSTRRAYDFYSTPDSVIDNFLSHHPIEHGHILEPCAGDGAILRGLHRKYGSILYSDYGLDAVEVRPEEAGAISLLTTGYAIQDFLTYEPVDIRYKTIISNPPFSVAEEIIEHCFEIAEPDTEIIMLLRLGFLESKKRKSFWQRHPCQLLYALSDRPSFTGDGTDKTAYGWFVWNSNKTGIYVI